MPKIELPALAPDDWRDYELLDSGDGQKLERWGQYTLVRPEPGALWRPALPAQAWRDVDAAFQRVDGDTGQWQTRANFTEPWPIRWRALTVNARLTPFRHTGIFPEQAVHWTWLAEAIRRWRSATEPNEASLEPPADGSARRPDAGAAIAPPRRRQPSTGDGLRPTVLNLFAYTGLASLAAAAAGAAVVHVDASRKAIGWAQENARLSGLAERPIRWLLDDAMKFTRREIRRGSRYEGILLDPPAFGRGPSGEIWRFEEQTPELLALCRELLAERPMCLIITAYAVTASALTLRNLVEAELGNLGGQVEAGELALAERATGRLLPTAIFARWPRRAGLEVPR